MKHEMGSDQRRDIPIPPIIADAEMYETNVTPKMIAATLKHLRLNEYRPAVNNAATRNEKSDRDARDARKNPASEPAPSLIMGVS